MKEAYEVLNDPHKRQTYDALGSKAMKWVDEPFSADPQELAHNFAKSSVLDRSKIFAIFVVLAIAILILPLLICLRVDGHLGDAYWLATLTPLWIWDGLLIFYHCRVIAMGPIPRPEHIPEDEWVDPLPMTKRYFSMLRFTLIVLFEILVALRLDNFFHAPWFVIFAPLYIWEATTLYKKLPLARMRIVTVEDLEAALGKPFSEFTQSEKDLIGKRYSVVSSVNGPDFEAAQKLKVRARYDIAKSSFRIVFCLILIVQLDGGNDWNWWVVFTPFWLMVLAVCYSQYSSFLEVQRLAKEKDPTIFGGVTYGSTDPQPSGLSDQEREELRAQVAANSSKLCSKCCSQGFLLILLCLFVAKLQGAGFSALWIISPFLTLASLVLCCIGGAIFGVTEVPTDGINFEDNVYVNAEEGTAPPAPVPSKKAEGNTETPRTSNQGHAIIIPPPADQILEGVQGGIHAKADGQSESEID
jgi:hypothetical protein